jgi:multiple sugar transport system substrate-binding protein
MKVVKSAVLLVLLLFLGVGLVFGGGQQAGGASSTAASGVETVYFYAWTNPDNMKSLLEAFNKEFAGKYEMVYELLPDSSTMTINTALASGKPITVMTQASASDLRVRADSGIYLGLKKFFDQEGETYGGVFGPSIEQTQNFNGDYYSLPYCNNINMIYYNRKLFREAGIPDPDPNWTWDDFREIAKKLTKGEGANKTYGAMVNVGANNGTDWTAIAQQSLGAFWYLNKDFRSTRFDAPEMRQSMQFFHDMMYVDQSLVPIEEIAVRRWDTANIAINGLYNDKFAMCRMPVFGCLYLNESYGKIPPGTDIGMANMPRPSNYNGFVSTTYTSTASVPANVKNPQAAWDTIKYICIDHAELFAGPKAMHPGYEFKTKADADLFNDIIFRNHPGFDYDGAMKLMPMPRTLVTTDITVVQGQARILDLLRANSTLVFNGEMTVEAALRDLKTKGDQYIAEDLAKK